jgi:type II secretory ATPase GspE/PulE/Tfp pilus assembly ATPase PilB-like protein
MTTPLEGLTLRTRWLGREFIPFDEVSHLEPSALRLLSGARHSLPADDAVLAQRALSSPQASGVLPADAASLRAYLEGAWSPLRAARALLAMASGASASDVHLESEPGAVTILFRCVGVLAPFLSLPTAQGERLLAALKHLSGCLPYRRDIFQEGRISREGVAADVRASFVPTALGERAALRLFGKLRTLTQLGFDEALRAQLESLLAAPRGLVLLAGASGAGKTTTLYAALAHLAATRGGAHLSLEDPVEQRLRVAGVPVAQVELCPERGLTGEAALVAALRQDLDVLAVGEIRTGPEAALAVQAAHTGRLVLAGVHAGSTAEARQRLLELGVDRAVLNATLVGVLHQRLELRRCEACEGERCGRCAGQGRLRVPVASLEVQS